MKMEVWVARVLVVHLTTAYIEHLANRLDAEAARQRPTTRGDPPLATRRLQRKFQKVSPGIAQNILPSGQLTTYGSIGNLLPLI